jgi:hypothetical protein
MRLGEEDTGIAAAEQARRFFEQGGRNTMRLP